MASTSFSGVAADTVCPSPRIPEKSSGRRSRAIQKRSGSYRPLRCRARSGVFCSLPCRSTALAWKPGRTLVNAGLVASALLLIGAGGLTRSYGFALGLLVLGLAWFVVRPGRHKRWRLTALALLFLVLLTAGIYSGRSGNYNPVTLRFQNWLTATEIFGAYPLGAGLHTYAVAYLQHQQPGANESQYAHNTPLQVLSELGVLGIVAGIFLIVYLVKHRDTLGPGDRPSNAVSRWH